MKKLILILITISITHFSFSQKKELKTVEKLIKSNNYTEAINILESLNDLIDSADDKTKAKFYYLSGLANYQNGESSFENKLSSIENFNNAKEIEEEGSKIYSIKIDDILTNLFNSFVNDSRSALENKDYELSYKSLEAAYNVSKRDTLYLYNAALVATEAKSYDVALNFYEELIDLGYTGISINYYATEKESGKEQVFQDMKSRDFSVDVLNTHISPRDEMAESVEIDILRSIAAIYRTKEDFDNSLKFLERAKSIDSLDINLILLESNIRWEMGEVDMYQSLITKALEIEPNNVDLIFNLGVVNADKGDHEMAIDYYNKAIAMDPTYTKAYLNAAALTLEKEGALIEEMNSLGMSTADYNRYDELKIERENLYRSAIPYLEKVYELENDNLNAARTLKNIFSALGDIESENKYKTIVAGLENK
ncbi:MAG: tetratricopeptide repeat protein [Flavobacteriaceae bacterium]|nr:tetratricopeptide repeat protein [Flavobacteriaceae bacterium]